MNSKKIPGKLFILASVIVSLFITRTSHAVPYACDVTNNAGIVSFRLNENADSVKVISSGGAVTNDLGVGIKGLTVTNLAIGGGGIKVVVLRSVSPGYTQTSIDSFQDNGVYVNKFEQPRGVVVDKNPASPSFGRIFVANGRGQANTGSPVRTVYQGIYLINSDDTVALDTGTFPRTAGLAFTAGSTASPLRLSIGKNDNRLYICDLSDPSGGLWVTDLDVNTNATAINVFDTIGDLDFGAVNHGSIYAAVVEGTLGGANLKIFTMDEDLTPNMSAWRYDVNGGPLPSTVTPVNLGAVMINTAIDLVKGGESNFLYASQNRSAGAEPAIYVVTPDGVAITNSLDASRAYLGVTNAADLLRNTTALDISPDGKMLALLRGSSFGSVLLVPLTNGVFNFAATNSFPVGSSSDNNRDIAFDAAGNLYVVNTANEWFRIFSKGGATVATTGSDGTFDIDIPPLLISASASIATANEQGPVNGQFTLTRSGDLSKALTVSYTLGGTADAGIDYIAPPGSVTFLPGATSTNIPVSIINDNTPELTETITLNINGSPDYGVVGGPATISILDNETPEVSMFLTQTETRLLEGFSASKIGVQVVRRGLLTPSLTVNMGYSGGAAPGIRINAPATVALTPGLASYSFDITPINDEVYQNTRSETISVAAGPGYTVGSTNSAAITMIDDDYPPGQILFADNFTTNSGNLWLTNSVDDWSDSAVDFAYDYSQLYIPPAPGTTGTSGLRFRLNELAGAPQNAVSISPAALNLTGDYHMKFSMWINYNGPMLDGGSGSTMHLTAGVGTMPDHANLATSGSSDGIWFGVDGDGGSTFAAGDVDAYIATALQDDASGVYAETNTNPRSTVNPYYSIWGGVAAPAAQLANYPNQTGISQPGNMGVSWHTVVITKKGNTVTWIIDGIKIATVPSDGVVLGSNVFVGYQDLFPGASDVPAMSFAVIDNFRVETIGLAPINIISLKKVGGNVEITFTGPEEKVADNFTLQSSSAVNDTYLDDASATLTDLGSGQFKATTVVNGDNRFYRIKM